MAELALAIIPLGLKTCSGLVSYLAGLKDRDDALVRLTRQAESLEGTFRSLEAFSKRGQLEPTASQAADNTLSCLKHCEDGLKELRDFEQKLSAQVAPAKVQDKMKEGFRKLRYPLQQSQLEQLEKALDCLCTPLSLAVQNLQLELEVANSSVLVRNTARIQQTGNAVSSLSTAIVDLNGPISDMQSQLPLLRGSVNAFVPQIDLAIQAQLQAQTEAIRLSFQEAESVAAQRHIETNELISKLHLQDSNPVRAIYKLASNPSALASLTVSTSSCSCRARRLRTRKTLNLGPFHLTDDIISEIPHFKDCNYYMPNVKYSRTGALRFTGLTKLINRAIEFTFSTTMGAGGFSISPSLTYFPMVDEGKAPAFRVLSLLTSAAYKAAYFDEAHLRGYLQAVLPKLQDIFRSGRSGPTDVDSRGNSLLHKLSKAIGAWQPHLSPSGFDALFNLFTVVGVPLSARNVNGLLSFHTVQQHFYDPLPFLAQWFIDDMDMPTQTVIRIENLFAENFSRCENLSPRITEALFGPLGLAIMSNDRETVELLINSCPEYLEEKSFYGESPFFMAIGKPDILELLVKKASVEQLVQPHLLGLRNMTFTVGTRTLLGRALDISSQLCETRGSPDGSFCPCVASINILLAADYPIIPYRDFWYSQWHNTFAKASMHCKMLVAEQLRMRRRRLRQLAEENLLHSELAPFFSSAAELDFQAIELDRLLSRKGLIDFGSLSTTIPDDINEISTEEHRFRPIYLDISNPEDASIFWDFGFLDIDKAWEHQWPFTKNPQIDHVEISKIQHRGSIQYMIWLYEYCPGIWRWIHEDHMLKGFAFILAHVIGSGSTDTHDRNSEVESIAVDILTTGITDDCVCQCSPGGCTPFDTRMKWLRLKPASLWAKVVGEYCYQYCYQSYVEDYGKKLTLDQHVIVVRQATFEALGMTHTCFDVPEWSQCRERDDVEFEIDTEDIEKARCLDDLVMDFRDLMLQDDEVVENEAADQAAKDVQHSQDERAVIHRRAVEYWGEVWPSRMHEIEESLAVTWNPDYQVLGDLGVSLQLENDVDKDEDAQTFTSEEEGDRLFDKFMKKLEMIE